MKINLKFILFVIIGILIGYYICKDNVQENFTVSDDIKKAINELYLADVEAIRNLSGIAKKLQEGGVTNPGNFNVGGTLNVNGNSTLKGITNTGEISTTGKLNVNGNSTLKGINNIGDITTTNNIILGDGNKRWILHKPNSFDFIIAPRNNSDSDWDWSKQTVFKNNGEVIIAGRNLLAEIDDLKSKAVRTDKKYTIQSPKAGVLSDRQDGSARFELRNVTDPNHWEVMKFNLLPF